MKIDIVVVYVPRYRRGHEKNFVPPITGIHLAALTPPGHEVRVVHQQVEPVRVDTDAELVALSFFSGFADEAFRLARALRARGTLVVAGGPHATFAPEECLQHVDAVVVGEAESVWAEVVGDAAAGRLRRRYDGEVRPLDELPTPRYDLLPASFFVPRVVQATRGCRLACSFCSVPVVNPGFRTRPGDEVIADIAYDRFPHWWQRKLVWFWDDNPTADRAFFKELPRRGWELYNGYNVAFRPNRMTVGELKGAHTALRRRAFSLPFALGRMLRALRLRPGAMLMSLVMNAFYGLKAARGNVPRDLRQRMEEADAAERLREVLARRQPSRSRMTPAPATRSGTERGTGGPSLSGQVAAEPAGRGDGKAEDRDLRVGAYL